MPGPVEPRADRPPGSTRSRGRTRSAGGTKATAQRWSGRADAASRPLHPGAIRHSLRRRLIGAATAALTLTAGSAVLVPAVAAAAPPAQVQAAGSGPVLMHPGHEEDNYKVLLFSKTAGFRHTDGIAAGTSAIQALGAANHFTVDATEDSAVFTSENLEQYSTVIFLSTTSPTADALMTAPQRQAFESYIEGGGGFFGIHAASDANYDWPWYGDLVGGYFKGHPAPQQATLLLEDRVHPSNAGLGEKISFTEEWYDFQANPRNKVHVLSSVDTRSYTGSTMGPDHPISWCQDYDGGRSAYTALGHDATNWSTAWFQQMVLGGIETTAGVEAADCGASVPGNYEVVSLDDNTSNPMMLDIAADKRVYFIELGGALKMIDPVTQQTTVVATLPVFTANESGLLGMALDPDFATNRFVYLYHSPVGENVDRLSRFTLAADGKSIVAGSEKVVLDVPVQRAECCHHGGSLVFDRSTGDLYLATGDNTNPFASDGYSPTDYRSGRASWDASRTSGNTNSLSGKLIRIHPEDDGSYTVPSGNLFAPGTAKTRAEIYGMGFRNPFRINIDPESGHVAVADYGPDAGGADPNRGPGNTVEWNIVDKPGNYGWPFCTGANNAYKRWNFANNTAGTAYECAAGVNNDSPNNTGLATLPAAIPATVWYGYDPSVGQYPEIGGGGAPMAGPVYRFDPANTSESKWPAYWDGKALFAEWNKNTMFSVLTDDAFTAVQKITPLTLHQLPAPATRSIKMMDAHFGPDGSLYIIDWGAGWSDNSDAGIYRIDYVYGNRSPIAKASADVTAGPAPLDVQFSLAGSVDPDGDTLSYAWNFGDGQTSTEANPAHTFARGVYEVQLTVTDSDGRTGVSNVEIVSGNTRPVVTITAPKDGSFFEFGDQITYTASVTDAEDGSTEAGTISCDLVKESSQLGHWSGGSSHAHPMDETTGCTATVQTLGEGGHGGDVHLFWIIEVSYTDKGNGDLPPLTGSSSVILQMKHRQAEHFSASGRIPGTNSTGDPGVQIETTSDPAGGTQNIGYIEPGDWFSFDQVNLTNIDAVSMRVAGTTGADFEVRWNDPVDGPLLGTVPTKATTGWQDFTDSRVDLTGVTGETGTIYFVAKKAGQTGSVVNVNWVDFIGKGATSNERPVISAATATPTSGIVPVEVALSAAATDPEGTDLNYSWDMGTTDGAKVAGPTGTYTYTVAGTYRITLTVTDADGGYSTRTFTVKVSPPAPTCLGERSDEFAGTALDTDRWQVVRPDGNLSVADGNLRIPTAPADLYQGTNTAPNVVLQPMPAGSWEITTKVTGAMYTSYQQAGLVVYGNDDNYVKLVFSGRSSSGNKADRIIQFTHELNASAQEANTAGLGADFPDTVWLRLAYDGTNLTPSYSAHGIDWVLPSQAWSGWDTVRKSIGTFDDPKVGLLSLANSGQAVNADFDFFHLTPDTTASTGPDDEFDGTAIVGCRWEILRPDAAAARVAGGFLELDTAPGEPGVATNVLLQPQPGGNHWTIETRVDGSDFTGGYQQTGLIAYVDGDNFVKLNFIRDNATARRIELRSNVAGTFVNPQQNGDISGDVVSLRLERQDNNFAGYYSADGVNWTKFAETVANIPVASDGKVGVYAAGVNQASSGTALVDFFHVVGDEPAPDTTAPVTTATVSDTDPAVLTLTAADEAGGSGVATTEYRNGTQTWTAYTAPVSIPRTAVDQSVEFRSTDVAGNVEATKSVVVPKAAGDTTAPVTTATVAPATPSGTNGWWTSGVTLTLTAIDEPGGSGVAVTQYALADGVWHDWTGPVPVDVDGAQAVQFRSTDVAGNIEATKSVEVKVDATAPDVAANLDGDNPVTVSLIAADATSGIGAVSYRIGAGTWTAYTTPFTVTRTAAVQKVEFKAVDKAGNTSPVRSVAVPAAPVVLKPSVTAHTVSPARAPFGTVVTASIQVTSTGTIGGELVSLYDGTELIGAGILKNGRATVKLDELTVGTHRLTARFAGNATVAESVSPVRTVTVDKAKSSVTLKASAITQSYGTSSPVKLTATVALDSKAAAAGQVRFRDGTKVLVTVPVVGGKATLKLSQTLSVGRHSFTAEFLPADTAGNAGAKSTATVVTVVKAVSTTTLKADRTSQKQGKPVVLTATVVLDTKQAANGKVRFTVDGKVAATVTVAKGSAKYTLPGTTKAGKHTVTATFLPASPATVKGSTSSTVPITITK
ncbi:DUF1349 domain-containing protein [Nakamurella sp. YIM 132087]|uniref:DUF1349 domain-containing protein n=1 Tax=Nakamurella alba TaxID=2665158 RepID=A0A7K1FKG0_9ACTN|nr:ThuA domain-containing protein [Nakamurella alba]MTD13899.1 DUF1349 domain-containing protein [Nakamurella alba]